MGITFTCNDRDIDCSYYSFKFFRDKLASKIGESFYELYTEPERLGKFGLPKNKDRKEYFKDHAQRSIVLCKKLKVPKKLLYFLWACDCEGKCSPSQASFVLRYTKNFTKTERETSFGYAINGKTVQDFINLFKIAVKENKPITWY